MDGGGALQTVLRDPNLYIQKNKYKMMLADLEEYPNKVNWAYLVKDLLLRMGFYDVWLTQCVGNLRLFLSLFKQRLTALSKLGIND